MASSAIYVTRGGRVRHAAAARRADTHARVAALFSLGGVYTDILLYTRVQGTRVLEFLTPKTDCVLMDSLTHHRQHYTLHEVMEPFLHHLKEDQYTNELGHFHH